MANRKSENRAVYFCTDGSLDPRSSPEVNKTKNFTQFLNPSLMVEHLLNPVDHSWNIDLLNAYIHPDDVKTIRELVVNMYQRSDSYGWSYTESCKYSVKSDFRT